MIMVNMTTNKKYKLNQLDRSNNMSEDGLGDIIYKLQTHAKIVTRTLTVAQGAATATATNSADINGIVLGAYFNSASADATATEIRSVRFVPSTGALTVTVNATATAATTIVVSIIQA
jgi:hypothetical protein